MATNPTSIVDRRVACVTKGRTVALGRGLAFTLHQTGHQFQASYNRRKGQATLMCRGQVISPNMFFPLKDGDRLAVSDTNGVVQVIIVRRNGQALELVKSAANC